MNIEIDQPIDRLWIVTLLGEGYDTYNIIKNYSLTEDVIFDSFDLLDKEVIFQGVTLSEKFIRKSLETGNIYMSDIENLNMGTYANFSKEFISEFGEFINWNRMILYISTQSDSFENYINIIDENNLWSYISANDLNIDFIRDYKDKLDWKYLSMVKCFTDEEKEEFSNYLIIPESVESGEFIDNSQFEFVKNMTDEELEKLIEEINKQLGNWTGLPNK